MKKILFLGAAVFQLPPIEYALSQKYRVFTCDNRPENPGHCLAEKSFSVSTVNRESVLELAKNEKVDAVLSYGSDVSMPTVAYVTAALGLSGPDPKSVTLLTNKARFRDFLAQKNIPSMVSCKSFLKDNHSDAVKFAKTMTMPFIVKPVDAAGSKGVSKVLSHEEIERSIEKAFSCSLSNEIIVESFFEKQGMQVCGNGFIKKGAVVFVAFGDGYFHEDHQWMAPWGESFPSSHDPAILEKIKQKIEVILRTAGYEEGPFNVDARVGLTGEVCILEIAPRNGGNYMDEAICLGSGIDLAAMAVDYALGNDVFLEGLRDCTQGKDFYACFMAHSLKSGVLEGVDFDESIRENLVRYVPYVSKGSKVHSFTQGNHAVGNAIFRFETAELMREKMSQMPFLCRVHLSEEVGV